MCNASNSANIDTTTPLSYNLVTHVFPAGNGDKKYGHINDVYLKTAVYTAVRYSISDVIGDQPALNCGILKAYITQNYDFALHHTRIHKT